MQCSGALFKSNRSIDTPIKATIYVLLMFNVFGLLFIRIFSLFEYHPQCCKKNYLKAIYKPIRQWSINLLLNFRFYDSELRRKEMSKYVY